MFKTSSEYRTIARQAENDCDWMTAAYAWKMAVATYPKGLKDTAIGRLDIDKMISRQIAATCQINQIDD